MLLKSADPKDEAIAELESLLESAPDPLKSKIKRELYILKAGVKGEQDAAYLINFDYEKSENWAVIHDLRIEIKGRVAQVDHLLINRVLEVYALESKHFNSGLKVTDDGEFLRWNDYLKKYEGMPSPLSQNERHIAVLSEAFEAVKLPERLGVRLTPTFHSRVLVSPNARIIRPEKFDTSSVIKADALKQTIEKQVDSWGVFKTLGNAAKFVDQGTLYGIGRRLTALHAPAPISYAARFGWQKESVVPQAQAVVERAPQPQGSGPVCKHCGSSEGDVRQGRYGDYFKCSTCQGNTSMKEALPK